MTKRMLIDATHAEETRVAVVDGHRLIEFDYESKVRKQLKGSIFLAKVTRVEPSLQAAFVNFGGNRHGFLPFSEIHPDYYRIPIADREALLAEQRAYLEAQAAAEEAEDEALAARERAAASAAEDDDASEEADIDDIAEVGGQVKDLDAVSEGEGASRAEDSSETSDMPSEDNAESDAGSDEESDSDGEADGEGDSEGEGEGDGDRRGRGRRRRRRGRGGRYAEARTRRDEVTESGESSEEDDEGNGSSRPVMRRNYKIQEVIKRGQIMLIQVSKEERGNKGAAVTTYLSLPGRYCVLMPNSPRAGGVSRKIASHQDRRRMREILSDLEVPQGMSVIVRTAGVARTKVEIRRDLDYLMRLWDNVRELTLQSTAPASIYEEGNLIKRSIRDIYDSEIEEIQIVGEDGYREAKDFMKMLVPSHAKKVQLYKNDRIPLFHRYQVESQITEIGEPTVSLRSGGYLVINPTEALVSIDVNSGRATKERHIEETALKTNLEAAEEVARQLRLRDLGGLVVIDFIDMEDRRNNARVERRLREALANDRARIQVGRISSFGLLELSRQRLNPSLTEAQFEKCPHCLGIGFIRSVDSTAVMALRALMDEGIKGRAAEVILSVSSETALYILNQKREMLADIERNYGFRVLIRVEEIGGSTPWRIEAIKAPPALVRNGDEGQDDEVVQDDEAAESQPSQPARREPSESRGPRPEGNGGEEGEDGASGGRRRRRGRRGGRRHRRDEGGAGDDMASDQEFDADATEDQDMGDAPVETFAPEADVVEVAVVTEETVAPVAEEEEAKPARKAPRTRRKAAPKTEEAPAEAAEPAVVESKPAPVKAVSVATPSNDAQDVAPARDYETVNQEPGEKKRGWWNRLIQSE